MPEILVENEPWLGLVVLADTKVRLESPGYYALARADEWYNAYENVTVWRGPKKREELIPRRQFIEMECQTVHVDKHGFYTCPPIIDDLKDYVEEAAEKILNEMANERAAEHLSYIDDSTSDDFDGEVWIKAEVGDSVAVNSEIVFGGRRARPPRGYVKTERGGWTGSEEEELSKEHLPEWISTELTKKLKRAIYPGALFEIIDKLYPKDYIYWSSNSGEYEVWVSKRALKRYEKKEEERKAERSRLSRVMSAENIRKLELESQAIEEQHKREAEERVRRIKRGGYPGPKDWSPRGRLPGDR